MQAPGVDPGFLIRGSKRVRGHSDQVGVSMREGLATLSKFLKIAALHACWCDFRTILLLFVTIFNQQLACAVQVLSFCPIFD